MDRTAGLLHLVHAEERLLVLAAEVRATRCDLADLDGFVDLDAAHRRGATLLGMGEDYRDDMRLWLPQSRAGRALWWSARVLLTLARFAG